MERLSSMPAISKENQERSSIHRNSVDLTALAHDSMGMIAKGDSLLKGKDENMITNSVGSLRQEYTEAGVKRNFLDAGVVIR